MPCLRALLLGSTALNSLNFPMTVSISCCSLVSAVVGNFTVDFDFGAAAGGGATVALCSSAATGGGLAGVAAFATAAFRAASSEKIRLASASYSSPNFLRIA